MCIGPLVLLASIVACRGVCTPAVYMYTCTVNGDDLSAVDLVYGWKVKAMFFQGSSTISPIMSIQTTPIETKTCWSC